MAFPCRAIGRHLVFLFVLLGVERLRIVENFTPSTHLESEFFPYTHSLVGSLVWAAVGYVAVRLVPAKDKVKRKRVALVIAAAVFSHWVLDLIVYTPALPLLGDNSPKVGLGLYNYAIVTFVTTLILGPRVP
jgi:membrane-bound metal-dependent hydrolase YbcI (DUF457 family)